MFFVVGCVLLRAVSGVGDACPGAIVRNRMNAIKWIKNRFWTKERKSGKYPSFFVRFFSSLDMIWLYVGIKSAFRLGKIWAKETACAFSKHRTKMLSDLSAVLSMTGRCQHFASWWFLKARSAFPLETASTSTYQVAGRKLICELGQWPGKRYRQYTLVIFSNGRRNYRWFGCRIMKSTIFYL